MKSRFLVLIATIAAVAQAAAVVPPAEKLLPRETIAVLSVPDTARLRASWKASPGNLFWRDPSMNNFRDKFMARFNEEFVLKFERSTGLRIAELEQIAQGQVTLAVVEGGAGSNGSPAFVWLVDSRDKAEQLEKQLADVKAKWSESGRPIKVERIRDIEFTSLIASGDMVSELWKEFVEGGEEDPEKPSRVEVIVGQSGSLLIAATSADLIEKVLARQAGGLAASLDDLPAFDSARNKLFRDSDFFVWVNPKPLIARVLKEAAAGEENAAETFGPSPAQIISLLGVDSIHALALSFRQSSDGGFGQFFVSIPQEERKGILKLFDVEPKDAAPLAFVPADAVKFSRVRIDMRKTWAGVEAFLAESLPDVAGVVKFVLDMAGKDKDPSFDFKRDFINNLGDDIVSYQKRPQGNTAAELIAPPAVTLIGSDDAETLARAIAFVFSSLGPMAGEIKQREFRGRTIYSLAPSPELVALDESMEQAPGMNFASGRGYVALSTNAAALEEFIRSGEGGVKPLGETAGLAEAVERIGGMNSGIFGFNNDREEVRQAFGLLKDGDLGQLAGGNPLVQMQIEAMKEHLSSWIDLAQLPEFEAVAKYFHFSVFGGGFARDGFQIRYFAPNPPRMGAGE